MIRFGVFFLWLATGVASAQTQQTCMWSDDLDAGLVDWHGESVVSETTDGRYALWSNQRSGSWTVVEYFPSGEACVLGYGTQEETDGAADEVLARFEIAVSP